MAKRALDEAEVDQDAALGADKRRKIEDDGAAEPEDSADPSNAPEYSSDDYTVGWICAITAEYVAAQAFLDETHGEPEHLAANDNNIYTLGKVGKHNVAITVLPHGEYGTASAATAGSHMRHSFPNIRIGLMVGIGGGAPSRKHDIRLGDIVVSTPRDGKGGVIQYDFGKTIQDQSFRLTGFLDQPPLLLRTAVNALKAKYEVDGHQIEDAINAIFKKRPRLRKHYQRPDPESDTLYQADVVHSASNDETCEEACGNNESSKVIARPPRTEEDDNPTIHYGMIASGNQLMKDALIRDKLAAEQDVLCFEMEAAGLMNHFPCLVIRGICDYSDSHKNKKWQGFAAMAAAAYAKDLLYRIPPSKIEAEKKIADIISNVQETVTDVSREVNRMLHRHHDEEDETILDWITPVDYAPQQNDFIRRRQPGTGQWLLDSEEFQTWVEDNGQGLFCPGIPGAGKTILAAIVVDDLCTRFQGKTDTCVAFIFCNFRRHLEQRLEDLLASLLKQVIQQQASVPDDIKKLCGRHKKRRTRLSVDELSRALQGALRPFSRTFIVIDALDECQTANGCRKSFLEEMFNLRAKHGVNLFTTSRFVPEIVDSFKIHSSLEIRANGDDVRRYLDGCIPQLPAFVHRDPDLQEEIKDGIVGAVDGMFLLAQLYMAFLTDKVTKKAIKSALRQFQKQSPDQDEEKKLQVLSEAYEQALERIKAQKTGFRQLGERTLLWITCAKRPLTVSELRHALAVEPETEKLDQDNFPETEDMVSACAGLVTVDEASNIIRLVHYTMQEYFSQKRHDLFPEGEESMAKICITYLSFSVFKIGPCKSDQSLEDRLQNNVLYDYAARNWGYHARKTSLSTRRLILNFLKSKNILSASSQAMLAAKLFGGDSEYARRVPGQMTAAHVAAHFGLGQIMKYLAENYHVDSRNSHGRTPLSVASEHGHDDVVEVLLEKRDVDINMKDAQYLRSPLSWAAGNGHFKVCKALLAKAGIEPESQDSGGRTPLSWAAGNGQVDVTELLLSQDEVLPDSKATWWNKGRTPLLVAAANGHESVVQLLIDTGKVDCDSKDDDGRTPLSHMVQHGYARTTKRLLARDDVNPYCEDKFGGTPLSRAVQCGHKALVEMLIVRIQVNPNVRDSDGSSLLLSAAKHGHEKLVRLLLEIDGITKNCQDKDGRTPLSWAVRNGHTRVITTLLSQEDVDPNIKDKSGQGPLSWAAQNMQAEAVNQLLDKNGIDPESRDVNGRTPFSWVAGNGDETLTKKLLAMDGVEVDSIDGQDRTPLSWAAENGHQAIVKVLLTKDDVNPNFMDRYNMSPVFRALMKGHTNIVKALVARDRPASSSQINNSSLLSQEQQVSSEPWHFNQVRPPDNNQSSEGLAPHKPDKGITVGHFIHNRSPPRKKRRLSTGEPRLNQPEMKSSGKNQSGEGLIPRVTGGKYTSANFEMHRTLGTGSFSRVYLAQSKHNQRFYAVKVLKKADVVKMKQVDHTNDERRVLSAVKHSFLVTLWGTWQDWRNIYMVMGFAEGGELFSLLRKSKRFPNQVAKFYAAQVAIALEYLHSKNIIYRDVKPENILLDRDGNIKLTDFSFAKFVPDQTWTLCGSPDYLAPELVAGKGYNKSVDWWALGVLIYEMLCGYSPFWDTAHVKIYENILRGEVKYPGYLVPEARNLMENLITSNLTKRLGNMHESPLDIKSHPWFGEVTWSRLENKEIDSPYIPPIIPGTGDASQFDKYPEDDEILGSAEDEDIYGNLFPDF